MFTKFGLPILAVAGVIFCVYTVVQARQPAAAGAADRRAPHPA